MKTTIATAIAIIATANNQAFASPTKFNPKIKSDGRRNLGIQYAYDQDKAWAITFASDISDQQLQ